MFTFSHNTPLKGLIASLLFLLAASPLAVSAQEQIRMKIQPTLIEEKVEPEAVLTKSVFISNLSEREQTLFPTTRDIVGIGADGRPVYSTEPEDREGMTLSSWITYQDKVVVVPPGSTREVRFTVTIPKNASPGSHFGGVFLTYQPQGEVQNATGVGYEIGAVVNLQIAGDVKVESIIREFSTTKVVYGEPNVQFTTRVENLGNVFVRPRGLIEVENMFGKKVETLTVNESVAGVLPRGTRVFETNWNPDGFQIGKYQAVVSLVYGDQNAQQTISSTLEFWILPTKTLLPTLGGLLALVLVIYFMLRMYVRRQLALAGRSSLGRRDSAQGLSRLAAVIIAVLVSVIIGLLVLFFYFG